jgi:hypothetical protein
MYCWDKYLYASYTILYIVRVVVYTIVLGGMSISWRGFYVLTKLTFIHPNFKFYATSAPYLVEMFQISNFVALQWFRCLRLQDSMCQTAPQESQNLYANRI